MRFFGRDRAANFATLSHEIVMLGDLSRDESGRVRLDTQRCYDFGNTVLAAGLTDGFSWAQPANLPHEQHELVYRDGFVVSEAPPRAIGYSAKQPDDCTPGKQLPARPDQAWLGQGTCTCYADPLPLLANDCRITDADKDGMAGLTVRHSLANFLATVRIQDRCQIVDGQVSPDGSISGHYVENYDHLSLGCGDSPCSKNDIAVCPREYNPALLKPLPALAPSGQAWDCAALMSEVSNGKFFPAEMLTFPPGNGC